MARANPLSDAETAEIRAAASHYPDKSAASIEALKIVQAHRGWVSDESLKAVAELLNLSPDDLDGVATFYNLIFRKPVGANVLLCCNSVSCWLLGSDRVFAHFSKRLGIVPGQTTPDGRWTLLPICCLGACDRAPVVMVGKDVHYGVDEAGVDAILASNGAHG